MNAKIVSLLAATLELSRCTSHLARADTLLPQDIVIAAQIGPAANNDHGLVVVDPVTGNRTILSDNSVGTGPEFSMPVGVAIEPDGSLLVADYSLGAVFRVDPATGDRTIISGGGIGTGPSISFPNGIADAAGTIYVANGFTGDAVLAVDPLTGNRTTFVPQPGDHHLYFATGLAVQGQNLLVASYPFSGLSLIDLSTGLLVSQLGASNIEYTPDVTVGPTGIIYVDARSDSANFVPGVFSVDPLTSVFTLVSGGPVGSGPTMGGAGPLALATESDGRILLTEDTLNAVLSINPVTGNRAILSDATHGTGPAITNPQGIAVVPVPEPSSIALLTIGAIGLAALARRKVRLDA
jgi:sugar lactone lactonase YvrE